MSPVFKASNKQQDDKSGFFVRELTQAQFDLYAFIRMLIGRQQDADDILQETNAALWRKREEFDPARPFMPWAKTFAHYQVKAYLKKQAREKLVFNDESLDVLSERLSLERYSVHKTLGRIEECIEKLAPKQRDLLEARYVSGLSLEDMASRMHCSINAVSILLCRMRQSLLHCLVGSD